MNTIKDKVLCNISNAYIFHELYKRGFIKSKNFQYAENVQSLQTKIMHVIKSSVNNMITSKGYDACFGSISFKRTHLNVGCNTVSAECRGYIFNAMMRDIVSNARVGLGNCMTLSLNGSTLQYRLDGLYNALHRGGYGNDNRMTNMKQDLDDIINTIMYVPISLELSTTAINYANAFDIRGDVTLLDIHLIFKGKNYHGNTVNVQNINTKLNRMVTDHAEFMSTKLVHLTEDEINHFISLSNYTSFSDEKMARLNNLVNATERELVI